MTEISLHETLNTNKLKLAQIENYGYGLIISTEGHRFISSIQNKQGKGEGKQACFFWQIVERWLYMFAELYKKI